MASGLPQTWGWVLDYGKTDKDGNIILKGPPMRLKQYHMKYKSSKQQKSSAKLNKKKTATNIIQMTSTSNQSSSDFDTPHQQSISSSNDANNKCSDFDCEIGECVNGIYAILYVLVLIGVIFGMMINESIKYHKRSKTEYHYTTCIVHEINDAGSRNSVDWIGIDFKYGETNKEWDINGYTEIAKDEWNDLVEIGDIGTCLYSENNVHSQSFTIRDYNADSSAAYLGTENRSGLIGWIIFWAFSAMIVCSCCIHICSGGKYGIFESGKQAGDGRNLRPIFCGFILCGIPIIIMAVVIFKQNDIHTSWDNIYEKSECIINDNYNISATDGLVKYSVFLDDEELIAVFVDEYDFYNVSRDNISDNMNDTDLLLFEMDSIQTCYQNVYTNQIVLDQEPSTEWLVGPQLQSTSISRMVLGAVMILFGCVCVVNYTWAKRKNDRNR